MGTLNRKIARRYGKAIDLNNFKADGSLETGAPTIYDSAGLLPTSGVANGTQAYVTANQKLYIRATGGWYNVATVNTTPTISSVADASSNTSPFDLSTDGSTTTVTVTATDSEGFPLTFTAVANSGFNGLATVAQDSSVFTITPKSEAAATTTEGTLTFRASDGVNIASEIATFTLVFKVDDSRFTTTLIKASGNNGTNTAVPTDASSNSATLTTPGSDPTNQALSPHHPAGYNFQVKGNTDAIAIDSGYFTTNSTWWTSSGFTMEGWINLSATNNTAIWDNRSSGTSGWMLNYNNTTGKISIYTGSFQAFNTTITHDAWHYIALTVSGTSANLYVDGLKDPTTCTVGNTASFAYFGKSQNTLGAVQYTPRQSNACQGKYRDFKFTAGVQYTGETMTVPTSRLSSDSNTALFVTMSPCLRDLSSNASVVSVLGSTYDWNTEPVYDHSPYNPATHGSSMYHESKQYYVRIPQFRGGTTSYSGEFTYEGWFYFTQYDGFGNDVIFTDGHEGGSNRGPFWYNNTYYMVLASTPGDWSAANAKSFGTIGKGWHHLALVRDGDTLRPFVNGVQGTTTTLSSGAALNFPNLDLLIATSWESWVSTAAFYLSEFRLVWGSALYTSNFTVPTGPLSAVTNTQVLVKPAAPNISANHSSEAEIVLVGDAKSSTAQTKYASASMYFDGNGDAVRVGSTGGTADSYDLDQFDFSDEPFSIEFWMRTASPSTYQTALSFIKYNSNGGNNTPYFYINGGSNRLIYWRDDADRISGSALSADTWYHVSYNRFGGRDALYINGTVQGNTKIGNTAYEQGRMSIGQYYTTTNSFYNSTFFNGYIEDVRITKGKIRNVMPTAETFTSDSNTTFLTAHTSTITDGSSNNHTITAYGSPTVSNFGPAPGMKSIYFDGTNDYLYMGTGLFGSGDFTIEFWWYPPEDGDSWTASDVSGVGSHTFIDSRGGTRLQLWLLFSSSSSAAANSTGGYTSSYYGNAGSMYWQHVERRWTHFAYQRTSGTLRCYVNGIDQGWTTTNNSNASANTTYIGARHDNQATRLKGYISNYRISNVARYTGNFTPTTAELRA